ncbi:hypothetical protein Ptr902_01232 [Pyrenophora tritici-repentis]|nr:hypothetical protein Ptr902_01232 [Pyrenophora tritici-repentis]
MSIVPLQHSDIIQFIRYHRARPFPTSTSPTTPATNTMHYSYILLLLCGIASAENSKRGDFHFIRIYGGRCVQVGGIKTGPKWRIPHTWQDDIKDRLIKACPLGSSPRPEEAMMDHPENPCVSGKDGVQFFKVQL